MRMFAGPNGSGKSTLKSVLPPELLGVYLNPDEIEKEIRACGFLYLGAYDVMTTPDEVLAFFRNSRFLQTVGLSRALDRLGFVEGKLVFAGVEVNAYLASVTVDFYPTKAPRAKSFVYV